MSLSREQSRALDRKVIDAGGVPGAVLMENAGRGAAQLLDDRINREPGAGRPHVLILCGPGNNGGDGGVVARHLDAWGHDVKVVWFTDPARLRGDAATQWAILDRARIDQSTWDDDPLRLDALIARADWVVDGLLGTGLTRPVEGPLLAAIEAVNRSGKPVLALDVPSGLDADRGVPLGVAVRARMTVTFVAPKLGFEAPGASDFTGEIVVVGIGVPRKLIEPFRANEP